METGEYYYTVLRDRASAEFMVVVTTSTPRSTLSRSVLEFDTGAISRCPSKDEFHAAIHKRFSVKRSGKGVRDPDCVVLWCLCTRGYKLTEAAVTHLTNSEVSAAWEFIDSMKKSSTVELAAWVVLVAAGRTSEGFKASVADACDTDRPVTKDRGGPSLRRAGVKPAEVMGHSHTFTSVKECLEHDAIQFAIGSLRVRGVLPSFIESSGLQGAQRSDKRIPGSRFSNVKE